MNSTMISYQCEFIFRNSAMNSQYSSYQWIHGWFYTINSYMTSYVWYMIHDFICMNSAKSCMNSAAWILGWIYICEFWYDFTNFHDIFHDHEFTSDFMLWIHIRFHYHEFICYISWPMNSVNIQIWIHVYEKYREFRRREIIYDIWGTKDPNVQASGLFFNQALNLNNWSFSAWEALKSIKWRMYQKSLPVPQACSSQLGSRAAGRAPLHWHTVYYWRAF